MTDKEIRVLKIAKQAIDRAIRKDCERRCKYCDGLRKAQSEIVNLLSTRQVLLERWMMISTK